MGKKHLMDEVKDVLEASNVEDNTPTISKEAETQVEQQLKKEMKSKKRPSGGVRIV